MKHITVRIPLHHTETVSASIDVETSVRRVHKFEFLKFAANPLIVRSVSRQNFRNLAARIRLDHVDSLLVPRAHLLKWALLAVDNDLLVLEANVVDVLQEMVD